MIAIVIVSVKDGTPAMTIGDMTLVARLRPALASLALVLGAVGVARADCNADFSALMSKRMVEIDALNKISKAHGGKLDPVAACPRLRSLAAAEGVVVAYIEKNKDWCGLPDDIADKMSATRVKTEGFAAKACGFAAKVKQMQAQQQKQAQGQQQQQEQSIRLPTGPL